MTFLMLLAMAALYVGVKVIDAVASTLALNYIEARPIIALTRDGGRVRVAVQQRGRAARPQEARMTGGTGILFGYQIDLMLPDGQAVICRVRFAWLTCSDGWSAERQFG